MKRSIMGLGLTLGAAALLALSYGCSKNSAPKEPSPTFESSMSAPAPEPGAPMGTMGAPTATAPMTPPAGQMDQGGQGSQGQQGTPSGQGTAAPMAPPMSEREVCDALKRDARITIEDVQGGVSLVLKPKSMGDLSAVREEARNIERNILAGGQRPPAAEQCALFDVGQHGGSTVVITEGPESVRLMVTTTDPAGVKSIRQKARDFAHGAAKPKSMQQHP